MHYRSTGRGFSRRSTTYVLYTTTNCGTESGETSCGRAGRAAQLPTTVVTVEIERESRLTNLKNLYLSFTFFQLTCMLSH